MISNNCAEVLQATFSRVPNELMQRMLNGTNNNGKTYSNELKAFAMTLQFYSKMHSKLVSGINGIPGFTKCAFDALSPQVCTDTANVDGLMCVH